MLAELFCSLEDGLVEVDEKLDYQFYYLVVDFVGLDDAEELLEEFYADALVG